MGDNHFVPIKEDDEYKVREVTLGDVEDLLRKIKNEFYRSTVVSKSKLKDQLHSLQLESYSDLSDYISALQAIVTRLKGLGYKVDKDEYRKLCCSC